MADEPSKPKRQRSEDRMTPETRARLEQAIAALEAVEWTGGHSGFSATCLWCRGYERHPAMDQDYYGKAGHKPDCLRQHAISDLRALLSSLEPPQAQERKRGEMIGPDDDCAVPPQEEQA